MHRLSGLRSAGKEEEMITFVEDRVFNDFRYHINSDRLFQLGWREQMPWQGTYIHLYKYDCVCMCACMYVYMYYHMYVYVCVCVCVCVYVCIHIYISRFMYVHSF